MHKFKILFILLLLIAHPTAALTETGTSNSVRTITIEEALESTRKNNITWQSLGEYLVQADAAKDMGFGMFLPKLKAEGQWIHMGERHTPDMSGFAVMGEVLGDLAMAIVEEHPNQANRFGPYADMMSGSSEGDDTFSSFVPKKDTISGTFSVLVPVFNPESIPFLKGAYDQYDAAVQRVGHGREQLLYAVAKAHYGLCTMQSMVSVADRSIEAAQEHHRTNRIKENLHAATRLEVKRAELEVTKAESQRIELAAGMEKAKAAFRYLTGIKGPFELVEPALVLSAEDRPLSHWLEMAGHQRRDLIAARMDVMVAEHEVDKVRMKYLPSLNLMGQTKLDNAEEQRSDDDPFSWTVGATMSMNLWDGGIREAELKLAKSKLRQAKMATKDLGRDIESKVSSAYQALADASAARRLAERQLEVARATQELAVASEQEGVATNLEVIDANTMVFASDAQLLSSRLNEAMAVLDLLAACGSPVPFGN